MGTNRNGEKVTKNCKQNELQRDYDNRTKENLSIFDDQIEEEEDEEDREREETEPIQENECEAMCLRNDIAAVPEREVCLVRKESGFFADKDIENQDSEEEGTELEIKNVGEVMCLRHDNSEVLEKEVCLVKRESELDLGKDLECQAEEEEEEQEGILTKNDHDEDVMCVREGIAEVPEKEVCLVKRDSGLVGSKDMDSLMIAEGCLEDGATDSFIPAYFLRRKGNKNARFYLRATTIMVCVVVLTTF